MSTLKPRRESNEEMDKYIEKFEEIEWFRYKPTMNLSTGEWYIAKIRYVKAFMAVKADRTPDGKGIMFKDHSGFVVEKERITHLAGFGGVR